MRPALRAASPFAAAALVVALLSGGPVHAHGGGHGGGHGEGAGARSADATITAARKARTLDTVLLGHRLPFPCGQVWMGSTRARHSPNARAVDFNRTNDMGKPVVATAPGVVTTAQASTRGGYGRWVTIAHADGSTTLYAHLKRVLVTAGQTVDQGSLLGLVGSTGNSTGAHLHYEQKIGSALTTPAFDSVAYPYGITASANCVDVPVVGNFSGDGANEVAVFRRTAAASFVINELTPRAVGFGTSTDEPVVGDWNGDGVDDLGTRTPRGNNFKLSTPSGTVKIKYGKPSDRPIAGDWDGDGLDDVGVWRAKNSTFNLRLANGQALSFGLGDADDVPVTGDWNGDGIADVGVYDRGTAMFTLGTRDPAAGLVISQVPFGVVGDLPVAGDWDGNGVDEVGTWSPVTATFSQAFTAPGDPARSSVRALAFGNPR